MPPQTSLDGMWKYGLDERGFAAIYGVPNADFVQMPGMIDGHKVVGIGDHAFSLCGGLSRVEIPCSVTNISATAFAGCSNVEEVVFAGSTGSALSRIKLSGVFADSRDSLRRVIVQDGIDKVAIGAFAGFDRLGVKFEGAKPTVVDENGASVNPDARREGVFGPYADVSLNVRAYYCQDLWGDVDTWCGAACQPLPDVTITPGGKTVFSGSISVDITSSWENAVIHYTADGTEPTADSPVFKKLTVNRKATVKATAISPDCPFHRVVSAQFGFGRTENPRISSTQGMDYFYWDNMISFSCTTPDVEYYYTIDGSDPVEHGTKYEGPFPIAESLTVKVVAKHPEYVDSDVVSQQFTRTRYTTANPEIKTGQGSPITETVNTVVLTCATEGAVIRYSTGGEYMIYTAPFKISGETTVSAYAVKDDWIPSETVERIIPKTWFTGDAVGMPGRMFASEGGNAWTTDTATFYDGGSSLRSAAIGDGETSDLQMSVSGKGTISFHWKTSCEGDPDFPGARDRVRFCIDGEEMAVLDGETGWESFSTHIDTEGTHIFKWEYVKDESDSEGDDCVWVDAVAFAPDAVAKVKFNGNENTSGELPTEITHYLGEKVTLPKQGTLARERYDFVGWGDGKQVYGPETVYDAPDTDITLSAVWEPRISSMPRISVKETYAEKSTEVIIYGNYGSYETIYYTTDGSTPTESSTRYHGGFEVSGGTTVIKAISVEDGKFPSEVASATTTCQWKSEKIGDVTWWYSGETIVGVDGLSGKVVLPTTLGGQTITKIASRAFAHCYDLLAVVIPEGIVEVGASAFCYCYDLQTVVFPTTVREVGHSCFELCVSLANVFWCMPSLEGLIWGDGIFDYASDSLVSHIPWTVVSTSWLGRTWTKWTPPANGATGMIEEVIGGYAQRTVTFDGNGGYASETSRKVVSGSAVGALPVPSRLGYAFTGWYTMSLGGTKVTDATVITADCTLYAQWSVINYAITYELGGGVNAAGNPATYTVEQSVTLAAPTRSGYVFKGWTPDDGVIAKGSTGDRRFVASWELAGGGVTYTLTFDGNGGTATEATRTVVKDGAYETLPGAERVGYDFAGWYTAASGGTPVSASTVATANARLYAHWTPIEYEIVYVLDGGRNNGANPAVYTVEDAITLAAPTRDGYVFKGWTPNGGVIQLGSTGTKEFTANWEVAPEAVMRTVSFDGNGGGTVYEKTRQVPEGSTLGTLPVILREGYVLAGWYTAATGGTKISETTVISASVTFYAHWTPENYNIVYVLNGSVNAAGNPAVYTIEDAVTLAAATRSGYVFRGWTPNGGVIAKGSTGDRKFTANWEIAGGGTVDPMPGPQPQPQPQPKPKPQPEPEPEPTVEIVEPVQAFVAPEQKTVKSGAVLAADGSVAGVVQLDVGKVSKKGESKVTVTIIGINGKKMKSKAVQVATGAGLQRVTFDVKGYGPLTLDIGADGFVGGASGMTVASVKGGAATGQATVAFSLADGSSLTGLLTKYLPNGVKVTRTAKKWTLPKAGKLKYVKANEKKGIVAHLEEKGENISGLKLSYAAKTGVLKGSFKLWTFDEAKKKLKSVSAKVTGVVINGVGYCEATVKKQKIGELIVE